MQQAQQGNQQQYIVRENYGDCPAQANRLDVQQTAQAVTGCPACTSIYMAVKDRSTYDRAYLRQYNRLPAQYNTDLVELVFAP